MVRAYEEWFGGYRLDPAHILERTFEETGGYDDLVLVTAYAVTAAALFGSVSLLAGRASVRLDVPVGAADASALTVA